MIVLATVAESLFLGCQLLSVLITGAWLGITIGNRIGDAAGWPRSPIRNFAGVVIIE